VDKFATDPEYIFQNLVNTDDFISLFNGLPENDYSEYISMMLHTTDLPHIVIDSVAHNTYQIFMDNVKFSLPIEVKLNGEIERLDLGTAEIEVTSSTWPAVDERGWYLKRVSTKKSSLSS